VLFVIPSKLSGVSFAEETGSNDQKAQKAGQAGQAGLNHLTVRAVRSLKAIKVDGYLNELEWQQAEVVRDFIQQGPNEGMPSSEPTEVRVLYDEDNLYIGFECYDSQPSKIVAKEMRRDGPLWQDDNVYIMIDSYNDQRRGFFFRLNPLAAQSDDAIFDGGANINGSWDCVWSSKGRIHERGWSLELAIPFNQLRFKAQNPMVWGINFGRNISRTKESTQWAQVPRSLSWPGTYWPIYQGKLTGLEGLKPSARLEIKPYLLPGISMEAETSDSNSRAGTLPLPSNSNSSNKEKTVLDAGLDIKYGITSNLTADLTVNTDFAQVEADQEQVNLTRFSLFFPEKRSFFLEGSGLFEMGVSGGGEFEAPPLLLFYSRRIGLHEDREIPILAGGKISGKIGKTNLGLLDVLTDEKEFDDYLVPRSNFSVVRLKHDILERSSLGLIWLNKKSLGSAGNDLQNRSFGLDLRFSPQEKLNFYSLIAKAGFGNINAVNTNSDDLAWNLSVSWRNDLFRTRASVLDIGKEFQTELGFVPRTDIRQLEVSGQYTPWIRHWGLRNLSFGPNLNFLLNHDNELQTSRKGASFSASLESGDEFHLFMSQDYERLEADFEIQKGGIIPAGEYEFTSVSLFGFSNFSRPLSADVDLSMGNFYNGKKQSLSLGSQYKPSGKLSLFFRYGHNRIELPADIFHTNVFSTRLRYSFTTDFFVKLFAQWNDTRERISANWLLSYRYSPGSDLFIVYDHAWDTSNGLKTETQTLLAKVTYFWSL
jgi:hypothetical protein